MSPTVDRRICSARDFKLQLLCSIVVLWFCEWQKLCSVMAHLECREALSGSTAIMSKTTPEFDSPLCIIADELWAAVGPRPTEFEIGPSPRCGFSPERGHSASFRDLRPVRSGLRKTGKVLLPRVLSGLVSLWFAFSLKQKQLVSHLSCSRSAIMFQR